MWVYEHVLCSHYGWSLEEVRRMDLQDFFVHLRICLVREDVEREFQIKLAGASLGTGTEQTSGKEQITKVQRNRYSKTETSTKSSRLRNEVGSLRVDKLTGKVVSFDQPKLPD